VTLEEELRKIGIPVAQITPTTTSQFKFHFEPLDFDSPAQLLKYADAFHTAKWMIKHIAAASGYESSFLPLGAGGDTHDLTVSVPLPVHKQHVLAHLPLFYPSLNSMRRFLQSENEDD